MTETACPICQAVLSSKASPECPDCGFDLRAGEVMPGWVREGVDLRTVARRQRTLLWFVLASLLLHGGFLFMSRLLSGLIAPVFTFAWWGIHVLIVVGMFQLLTALRRHILVRILYIVLAMSPCFGLAVLLVANGQATRALRSAGLRVGLFGIPDEQIVRLLGLYRCRACGYSLIGNTSGRCPECGSPVPGQSAGRAP